MHLLNLLHQAPRRSPESLQPSFPHHLWKILSASQPCHRRASWEVQENESQSFKEVRSCSVRIFLLSAPVCCSTISISFVDAVINLPPTYFITQSHLSWFPSYSLCHFGYFCKVMAWL